MKITLTGSLGNIGRPLTQDLVTKGHEVTVISSNADRQQEIESLGAKAAIGTMTDVDFLTETFTGADIVYVMETLGRGAFNDPDLDVIAEITRIGGIYKEAIERSGVKKIVHLSSIGGHLAENNGLLKFHYNVEQILGQLPADVAIKFMRPVGFYTNIFAFIGPIKQHGAIFANYGGDNKMPWVSPVDIAAVIAEEMDKPFEGRTVRYIASDEVSTNELAHILGEAIGKPDLQWVVIPDEQMLQGLLSSGMNKKTAEGYVEMMSQKNRAALYEDYAQHRPVLGNLKLKEFAKTFAVAYNKQ